MKYLQALLYALAATLAPMAVTTAAEQPRATAQIYASLSAQVEAQSAGIVGHYLEKVDPDYAPTARRMLRDLTPPRAQKLVRRLQDRKQQYVRLTGLTRWERAHRASLLLAG